MSEALRDLRERMEAHDLARRRWRRKASSVRDRQAFGEKLKTFAEESGPAFVAFANDLSTRLDLLPLSDCIVLAEAADRTPQTPFAEIADLIEQSIGSPIEDLFAVFDQEPVRSSLLTQWHEAVTIEGQDVLIEVVRPDIVRQLRRQLDQLHVLESLHLPDDDWRRLDMSRLIDDFRSDLEARLDLLEQKKALESLASEIVDDEALTVAEPVGHLCSRDLMTINRIAGRFVDSLEVEQVADDEDTDSDPNDEDNAEPDDDVARQLCLAWMQQALFGESYLSHARAEHFMLRDDGRFAVLGGGISRLTAGTRKGLLDYLAAASRQDPDLAAVLLARETDRNADASRETLRLLFRQAEPFRDGGWIPDYAGPRLAHELFVQWRLASRSGFEPRPHLRSFLRGLAELERTTRQMAPSRDALRQGLDDVRVIGAAVNLRELFGPTHLIANLERLLPASQEILHRLNEISLDVNEGRIHLNELSRERHRTEPSRDAFDLPLGLLMMMTAVALLTPRVASLAPNGTWIEPLGIIVFLAVAGMLFRQIGKQSAS